MTKRYFMIGVMLSGCLSTQLRQPAAEHAVQLATLCEAAQVGDDKALATDVCESAKQACLIEAIVNNKDGESCLNET